jgi:hypothetical protein
MIPGDDDKSKVFYESARDLLDAIASHLCEGGASLVGVHRNRTPTDNREPVRGDDRAHFEVLHHPQPTSAGVVATGRNRYRAGCPALVQN